MIYYSTLISEELIRKRVSVFYRLSMSTYDIRFGQSMGFNGSQP